VSFHFTPKSVRGAPRLGTINLISNLNASAGFGFYTGALDKQRLCAIKNARPETVTTVPLDTPVNVSFGQSPDGLRRRGTRCGREPFLPLSGAAI
jgi:hypothetical protein